MKSDTSVLRRELASLIEYRNRLTAAITNLQSVIRTLESLPDQDPSPAAEAATVIVDPSSRRPILEAVQEVCAQMGMGITRPEVVRRLSGDRVKPNTVSSALLKLENAGCLVRTFTGRGRVPSVYMVPKD